MKTLHRILAASNPLLKYFNYVARKIKVKGSSELRVLLYHEISIDEQETFKLHLEQLSQNWSFITPQVFEEMLCGKKEIVGKNLLLTFDDGFCSNRRIAEAVLDPMGIKALFFIISDFPSQVKPEKIKEFVAKNILPHLSPGQVHPEWRPMTWDDIFNLLKNGHSIGSHTRTHARLSKLTNLDELQDEIITSKLIIEKKLGKKVKHFAYTFGDIASFNEEALNIANEHYAFIHTGLRGSNINSPAWAIRRDALSPENPYNLVSSLLEGGADLLYKKKIKLYESWADK